MDQGHNTVTNTVTNTITVRGNTMAHTKVYASATVSHSGNVEVEAGEREQPEQWHIGIKVSREAGAKFKEYATVMGLTQPDAFEYIINDFSLDKEKLKKEYLKAYKAKLDKMFD